jgi:hypothetical protein
MYEMLVLIVTLFQGTGDAGGGAGVGSPAPVVGGLQNTSMSGVQEQFVSHSSQLVVSFTLQLMACMKYLC